MKFNKILAGFLSLVIVGGTAQIYYPDYNGFYITSSAEEHEFLTYEKYDDHIEITGCDKSAESVEIPAEIDGLPVTIIGEFAFSGCKGLTSITIPDGVTSIGEETFSDCINLTSVTIPDSVKSIGGQAFTKTKWLYLKREETPLVTINGILIDGQTATGEVNIPDSVTSIGERAFNYCIGLTSVTIPDSVTSIGRCAFYGCKGLTSVTIPDSVTSIGSYAFYGCKGLTSVTIPDSVTRIETGAFCYSNLISVIIPDGVTEIREDAFLSCKSLTSVTIPDSVTNIESFAFYGCENLTSVTIPDSVTSIGDAAFASCENLTSVTIKNPDCEIFDDKSTFPDTTTIYGYPNSTAQAYAEKYNYNFVALDDESAEIKYGDANGDGDVTIADAVLILQSIANPDKYKLTEKGRINADVVGNGDGVTANDALTIQMVEAGNYKAEDLPIK